MYPGPLGQYVLTTSRTDHLPNFLTNHGLLVQPECLEGRRSGRLLPSSLGDSFGHRPSILAALQPRAISGPEQRLEMWNNEAEPGSRPSLTIGSQVHFCLCHLPSHLKGSHDGFISYLNSFQLSLIILQISKSSQAKADRERNMPSATHRAWGSLPHL